jgi:hypothetical protein
MLRSHSKVGAPGEATEEASRFANRATQLCFPGVRRVPANHPSRHMLQTWNASHSPCAHISNGGCESETRRIIAYNATEHVSSAMKCYFFANTVRKPPLSLERHYQAILTVFPICPLM